MGLLMPGLPDKIVSRGTSELQSAAELPGARAGGHRAPRVVHGARTGGAGPAPRRVPQEGLCGWSQWGQPRGATGGDGKSLVGHPGLPKHVPAPGLALGGLGAVRRLCAALDALGRFINLLIGFAAVSGRSFLQQI